MKQDTGNNQVVIDWLANGDDDRVFVSTDDGSITYGELSERMPGRRTSQLSSVTPRLDLASVVDIYAGLAAGPLRVSDGRGWSGYEVPADVMTVMSTSGTTGEPKLVPLTVQNWEAAMSASATHLGHDGSDTWLLAMPLHHVGGLAILLRSSFVGGSVRLLAGFQPSAFAESLSSGVTMASVVPTMLRRILDHDTREYQGMKAVLVGGGPIPRGLLEEARDRGLPVVPTYGMTETCAQVATLLPGSPLEYRADLLPGVEAKINAEGRICLRGPQIFRGYLGEAPRDPADWYITGDLGSISEDGSLQVFGRADDVIISGGENIDPRDIEAAVAAMSGVEQCMVVGVPSGEWGNEVVCLYVGDALAESLKESARDVLQPFQVPKRWVKLNTIPLTEMGKPDRAAGRALAMDV